MIEQKDANAFLMETLFDYERIEDTMMARIIYATVWFEPELIKVLGKGMSRK